jgi:hypothetical protein
VNKNLSAVLASTLLGALCIFGLSSERAGASVTATWNVDSYKSFNEGEAEAAFITSLGEVRPGWSNEKVELEFDSAWSSVQSSNGTTYIGSDDKATIYQVKGNKVSKLATVGKAVAVVSMALDSDNSLYVGTMPDGEVWKVDTKNGKTRRLATLKDTETVWALTLAQGALYAGTGPEGLLYRIDKKSGKTNVAFDSEDKRIMSLLTTGDGAVWLGTSEKALVFRHDLKTKKTRAVADFAGNEVSALAEWKGTVIAAANDLKPASSTGFKTKESVDKTAAKNDAGQKPKLPAKGSKPGADKATQAGVEPQAKSLRKGTGALYRIRGDGQLTQLHALTSSYFTSIAINSKGQIFAGAADKGRIYLVDEDESVSTATDVEQRYIAQVLINSADQLSFTTGDATSYYRSAGKAKKSSYSSKVFDADTPSRFGRLVWHSSGSLSVETRSGNTGEPGPGWSAWQTPGDVIRGVGNISRAKVKSPPGRYFQYRVNFGADDSAALRKTSLFYLPANKATRLTAVTVEPATKIKDIVPLGPEAAKPRSPVLKVKWNVDNEDGDKTAYDLAVRREGEVRWRSIRTGEKPLTKEEYEWNTETFPDGYYRLRVNANDRLANTLTRSLKSSWTTALFVVDNERPKVTGLSVRYPAATARATDAMSTIAALAFSVDDGPWQIGGTQDGIFDDQSELLRLALPSGLAKGAHTLAIRVADSAGNVGSSTTSFRVD